MIGGASGYPDGSYEERQAIFEAHKSYTQGLLWFWGHDESIPEAVRNDFLALGLCKDEFIDTDHWPSQVSVTG